MLTLVFAFISSIICTFLLIKLNDHHSRHTSDSDLNGPQKIHKNPVSRIGGLGILLGISIGIFFKNYSNLDYSKYTLAVFCCAIPIFIIGFIEDLTKKVSVRTRLIVSFITSAITVSILDLSINHIGVPIVDRSILITPINQIIATIALTGLANSYNMIDGLNGLASMVGMMSLLALGYVAFKNADFVLMNLCIISVGSILGFFIWNFPRGLIFLGDGGSYFIGFMIATLSIALINRNPSVSPWFALLLNLYPIFETLFSIWRRSIYQNKNATHPDGSHFHTLIYKRIFKSTRNQSLNFDGNSKASPYIWTLALTAIVPATLFWNNQLILQLCALIFCLIYLHIYRSIVTFNTPTWLKK